MRAGFSDPSVFHHDDQIGVADGRKPMRDHHSGALAHQILQRRADGQFVDRIQVRRGLVQDQHRRVLQKGAGNRHALTLTAG